MLYLKLAQKKTPFKTGPTFLYEVQAEYARNYLDFVVTDSTLPDLILYCVSQISGSLRHKWKISSDRVHLFTFKFTTHDIHFKTMLLGLPNELMLLVAENLELQADIYTFIFNKKANQLKNKKSDRNAKQMHFLQQHLS